MTVVSRIGTLILSMAIVANSAYADVLCAKGQDVKILRGSKCTAGFKAINLAKVGIAGDVGPQGVQGVKGDKGDIGPVGPQGAAGAQGLKGDKGDQGIQGIQGLQGVQGLKGDKGDTGAPGATGAQGLAGTSINFTHILGTCRNRYFDSLSNQPIVSGYSNFYFAKGKCSAGEFMLNYFPSIDRGGYEQALVTSNPVLNVPGDYGYPVGAEVYAQSPNAGDFVTPVVSLQMVCCAIQ